MRFVIVGAGAIGATLAARLDEGDQEVVLIARGEQAATLRRDGLAFHTPDGSRICHVQVAETLDEVRLRSDDAVVLAVKSQDTAEAVRSVVHAVANGGAAADGAPRIVCAQNGIANEQIALRHFSHVYGMCLRLPATYLRPGHVAAEGWPSSGVLVIGRYPRGIDDVAHELRSAFGACHFRTHVDADVMRWKRAKLLDNVTNGVDALMVPGIAASRISAAARAEAKAVFDAAELTYATSAEEEELRAGDVDIRPIAGEPRQGSSAWQSMHRRTGSIETDYLNGEIVLIARMHGLAAPINEAIQTAATVAVVRGLPPRTLDPAVVLAGVSPSPS